VLTATGEIDLSNVEPFSQALTLAVAEADSGTLTVDLSGVEYLDSAAVNALFPHADHIRVIAHPFLVRVFDISGFTELTTVESSPTQGAN
jgi:anti-anti-sigma factor